MSPLFLPQNLNSVSAAHWAENLHRIDQYGSILVMQRFQTPKGSLKTVPSLYSLMMMKSMAGLAEDLFSSCVLKYLCLQKLNQDHVDHYVITLRTLASSFQTSEVLQVRCFRQVSSTERHLHPEYILVTRARADTEKLLEFLLGRHPFAADMSLHNISTALTVELRGGAFSYRAIKRIRIEVPASQQSTSASMDVLIDENVVEIILHEIHSTKEDCIPSLSLSQLPISTKQPEIVDPYKLDSIEIYSHVKYISSSLIRRMINSESCSECKELYLAPDQRACRAPSGCPLSPQVCLKYPFA
ncbi:hypothetical protein CAPTEDRAFT_217528 [Capitella teleta]|uniref:Uncharacterized protein n=1 Tax=Capitella teleta TaxID=283909 RepID=R7UHW7_CAPTE|nr:hypothetical protein CAPTEDRAFT_217528 [Capitella teleta]|eukprot:ELU05678.1 hypothetical protein CAPTEDRAFT_217528 [Capitella teleta]